MRDTIHRLLCYSGFIVIAIGLLNGWPEPPQGPLANRIAYCLGALFPWILIFTGGEIIYRIRQRRRAANRDSSSARPRNQ